MLILWRKEKHKRRARTIGDDIASFILKKREKILQRNGVALQQLIPTQHREKNCHCDQNIRGFKEEQQQLLHSVFLLE